MPRPLSIYLGAAMTLLPPDADDAARAAHRDVVTRMIEGIHKYQAHPWCRPAGEDVTPEWQRGTVTLHRFGTAGHQRVLVVPSMINGSEIFDLLPDFSFVRWLAARGFDVYLLDWGVAADDPVLGDIDGVLTRIADAAAFIGGNGLAAIGYCMGGTLLLGAAARNPEMFGKLVLLSAPWDFHAGDARMLSHVMTGAASAMQLLEERQVLPVDWIQNVFARVNPTLAIKKFSNFLDLAEGSIAQQIFIAVEDWLNGGQDLPAGVARACITDWYGRNLPGRGEWVDIGRLPGRRVMVVAAEKDILVPPESASAAVQHIPGAVLLTPPCGHISLMAGRKAPEMVWAPVASWLNGVE